MSAVESAGQHRLVARFWNEDGVEMPPLYRSDDGSLHCNWNYLLLVAPEVEAVSPAEELAMVAKHALQVMERFPEGHLTRQEAKELAQKVLAYLEIEHS